MALPAQDQVAKIGFAIQCRITTEDPENKFMPDYGKILDLPHAGRLRRPARWRLGVDGAVITPFYDSMLVKVTASGRTYQMALDRMDRALREFRIRGVKTNIPFLENVIADPDVPQRAGHDALIDTTPSSFSSRRARTARPSC